MPRGSLFPVTCFDAVAEVTVRTIRTLVGTVAPGPREDLRKGDVSRERKVAEKMPEEIDAISASMLEE